jgi:iron complex outermembrane recepter protein
LNLIEVILAQGSNRNLGPAFARVHRRFAHLPSHEMHTMARFTFSPLTLAALATLAGLAPLEALAQANSPSQSITITGRSSLRNAASVAGFGDVPLAQSPFSGNVITTRQLQDAGIDTLADITRLDAATTDAYNAPGYWGQLAVRGYTLDARFNYRRDGLPINAETVLITGNKQALELVKGPSGLQAGTSAPGGLVNLVVKRPQGDLNNAAIRFSESGNLAVSVDVGRSVSEAAAWRLNAQTERLNPALRNTQGSRHMVALAAESSLGRQGLLEAEVEWSSQSQPSMPGFSLLGNQLPNAQEIDPRINLNNQAWSQPVVFTGTTASLRYTHTLSADWRVVAHAMQQALRTQDRVAFPFGCSSENDYTRYCSDGSFDLYDFRSEGERRTSRALDLAAHGQVRAAGFTHHLSLGVLATRFDARFNEQAYNWVGVGTIDGKTPTPSDASLTDQNTNRSERSVELRLQDRWVINSATSLWAGLRHTQLHRDSVRTNGSRATAYPQGFTTPWLGLTFELSPGLMAYGNTSQGVESEVAPNRSRYTNAGQPLHTLKSRQWEAGMKQRQGAITWNAAVFDISRPLWSDVGTCELANSCTRTQDGSARHQGLEADAEWNTGPYSLRASAMALKARRQSALSATENGLQPTNVPARTLKLQAAYNVAAVPGLALLAHVTHEGARMVLPDNSVATPGWTRWDLSARYATTLAGATASWRLGVDNATAQRAWKEAPYQYGHAYLYPLAPRQWHGSVQFNL